MTEPTTPETPDLTVHASLHLAVNDGGGIDISVVTNPETSDSRAVHFAHWIGHNLEALILLADKDRAHQQEHAKNQRLITGIGKRLLVPEGAGEIVVPGGGQTEH
jgi:hypothetical protein